MGCSGNTWTPLPRLGKQDFTVDMHMKSVAPVSTCSGPRGAPVSAGWPNTIPVLQRARQSVSNVSAKLSRLPANRSFRGASFDDCFTAR